MDALRRWMAEHEMTQTELASRLSVSQPTVWGWLNGASLPSPKNLRAISALTGLTLDVLLKEEAA
jgi:transcriptional regulator with XRE-family HTH domain